MIIIPRKKGESIVIDDDIILTVLEIRGDKIRFQIEGPPFMCVGRREVYDAILSENADEELEFGPASPVDDVRL